ncbi:MAG TPA: hypothetical protein VK081_14695 [Planctomycetota bacterium]|nr:hypothetical protein [Planctomycetota bacterium]
MARAFDAMLAGACTFGVAHVLRQQTFYKGDGHVYLQSILEGNLQHPHHLVYKPLVLGVHRLSAPLGASLYDAGVLASALGTAVGIACAVLASRILGLTRGGAFAVAGLMLSVPALLFFATVVELHGVFLAFAGPALVAFAHLARAPGVRRGLVFGASLALAYVGHASAALLPALLLPLALYYPAGPATPAARLRALIAPTAAAGAVFALFLAVLPALGAWTGLGADTSSAAAYVVRDADTYARDARRWVTTLAYEWLLPYAPLGLVALAACFVGPCRGQARWLCAAVVPYYLVCVFLLPSPEFGAYLTPFAWPLALLARRVLPRAGLATAACAGLALGLAAIAWHDRPGAARDFAASVRAAAGGRAPFLLLGDHDELKAKLIALPDVPHLLLLHAGTVPQAMLDDALDRLEELLRAQQTEGRAVLLSDGAVRVLEQVAPSGPLVLPALRARFAVERAGGGFAGFELRAR